MQAEGDVGARALAAIDPASREALTSVTSLGWVPARHMHDLNQAFLELAGEARYLETWKRHLLGTPDIAFFQGLFAGAIRIFGKTPIGLTRWIGRAWDVTTRDHGEVTMRNTTDEVVVQLAGCPEGVRHPTVPLSMKATIAGLFEMAGCVAHIEVDTSDLRDHGRYALVGRWSPRPDDAAPEQARHRAPTRYSNV